jgi:hypothetical protein
MMQRIREIWKMYQGIHWKFVHVVVRTFGILAMAVGGILSLVNGLALLNPNTAIMVNGIPRTDLAPKLFGLIIPAGFILIGILCFLSPLHVPGQRSMFSFWGKRRRTGE